MAQGQAARQVGIEPDQGRPIRETTPLNNNRGNNNNRRRGRGNRQQQGGSGGQQLNRVDSRARGNAPQLLEKYRKMAHDAHLNGDRVQAEYFLQFADHYFRVSADGRQRQEEQRLRRDDRWEGGAEESDEAGEFAVDNDFPSYDQPSYARPPRDDRPQRAPRPAQDDREDRPQRESQPQRDDRQPRAPRPAQGDREDRPRRFDRDDDAASAPQEGQEERLEDGSADEMTEAQASPYDPPANPFVRDNRTRGLRPRRDDRRPRQTDSGDGAAEPVGLDPASLPPAISASRDDSGGEEEPAKPRRGRPRKKPSADDAGEALESVS